MKIIRLSIWVLLVSFSFSACIDYDDGSNGTDFPDISISDLDINEGDEDNTITIEVNLSGETAGTVVVNYASVDKTAFNGADYEGVEGSLSFAAGETSKNIEIKIKGDEFREEDERFELLLLNPINADLLNTKAVITIKDDDSTTGNDLDIPTTGYVSPSTYANYTLVWNDEFQGGSLDESAWNYEIGNGSGGWGNNELQYYKSENTSIVEGNYLMIEAKEEIQSGFGYTSSRLTTQGKKTFKYGRIDVRAVLPEGQGIWPAIWMLGENINDVGWPACGEIDIMELVGHLPNQVHGTVHFGDNVGQHQFKGSSSILSLTEKYSDEFHVFSIIWEQDKIEFLVDDQVFFDIDPSDTAGQNYPFNEPFFFIFNVAVGGNWPGSPDGTTIFPQRMIVDYIRVFQ